MTTGSSNSLLLHPMAASLEARASRAIWETLNRFSFHIASCGKRSKASLACQNLPAWRRHDLEQHESTKLHDRRVGVDRLCRDGPARLHGRGEARRGGAGIRKVARGSAWPARSS